MIGIKELAGSGTPAQIGEKLVPVEVLFPHQVLHLATHGEPLPLLGQPPGRGVPALCRGRGSGAHRPDAVRVALAHVHRAHTAFAAIAEFNWLDAGQLAHIADVAQ